MGKQKIASIGVTALTYRGGSFAAAYIHREDECRIYKPSPSSIERLQASQKTLLNGNGHVKTYRAPASLTLEAAGKTWNLIFNRFDGITCVIIVCRSDYPKNGERAHLHNAVGACKRNPADADDPAYADRLAVKRACGIPVNSFTYNYLGSNNIARQVYSAFRAWQRDQQS